MKRINLFWPIMFLLAFISPTELTQAKDVQPKELQQKGVESQELQDAVAYYLQGVQHYKAGRYNEAVEAFQQAIRLKPDYSAAHHGLGYVHDELGQYKKALESTATWP
jgi:Flp pilus assembly protein TadD